eukprot:CAMPEP_0177202188 /NCGR_PEP_ID=MMETSP0367-20130122/27156_1 /TAXON_ID=447022 ORGANISM="Scrippsiella hangoei-like, Strain SHHI-4" /NCGR_SAMPLE_ID=MMETSP0367 /ASSEMBLY_ACC=CAM_ASM_000362 /LENGTH=32 /DNA_ID= /DNA_START= /DNA_END= /DNA_ORIENTATION=
MCSLLDMRGPPIAAGSATAHGPDQLSSTACRH